MKLTVTFASPINATAFIAEFFAASAPHMIAPLCFLNPELTEWTLLVFCASHKFLKCFIRQIWVLTNLILSAILPFVIKHPAGKAISFLTGIACKIIPINLLIKYECVVAISCWTPRYILLYPNGLLDGVVLELLHFLQAKYLM
jgi:hypothetical protein